VGGIIGTRKIGPVATDTIGGGDLKVIVDVAIRASRVACMPVRAKPVKAA
jgi:hypothetical protein